MPGCLPKMDPRAWYWSLMPCGTIATLESLHRPQLDRTMNPPSAYRTDVQVPRKLWHAIGVLNLVIVYQAVPRSWSLGLMAGLCILGVALELVRLRVGKINAMVTRTFGPLMRDHERESWAGSTYILLGAFLTIAIFPAPVASLSLLFLALADPVASYFGIRYGTVPLLGAKTLRGTLAAFATCTAVALVFYASRHIMVEQLLIAALLSGLAGAIAELLPVGSLDDNLTQPVLSATMLYLIFQVFGGAL